MEKRKGGAAMIAVCGPVLQEYDPAWKDYGDSLFFLKIVAGIIVVA